MIPSFTSYNSVHSSCGHTEHDGESCLRELTGIEYFAHLNGARIGKFCRWVALAAQGGFRMCSQAMLLATSHPAFPGRIPKIVGVGADKQMVRPHARRVVAMVADMQTVRDGAIAKLPREPVGQHGAAPVVDTQDTVTAPVLRGGPQPTRRRFTDLGPEPLFSGRARPSPRLPVARAATEALTASTIGCGQANGNAAFRTRPGDTIGLHREDPLRGARPRDGRTSPGLRYAYFTTSEGVA